MEDKNTKKIFSWPFLFQLAIVGLMYIAGFVLLDSLPAQMPMHWNIAGEIDNYMDKNMAIIVFPSITLAITLMFPFLSRIDPRRENYELFKKSWIILQATIVIFFAYLYFVTLYLTFHPEVSIIPFIFSGIGVLFMVIGNYLGKIRQNYFVGVKTPWTLDNEEVWNKTHRLAAYLFFIAGFVTIIEGVVQWYVFPVFMGCVAIAALVPIIYSYVIFKKYQKNT
ncbi:SdpI family protein [Patescibacteria group bacterium]|nr:SdpI family protein [Patescibacteria group bacterium]